jgi:uncharacterized membrane protein
VETPAVRALLLVLAVVILGGWLTAAGAEPEPRAKPAAVDYQRDVVPILEAKCNRCHTEKKAGGKLITTSRAAMLKGGASGPAIEPGNPDKSILIELIHFNEMPPKRVQPRVTADELKLLKAWIAAGAPEK